MGRSSRNLSLGAVALPFASILLSSRMAGARNPPGLVMALGMWIVACIIGGILGLPASVAASWFGMGSVISVGVMLLTAVANVVVMGWAWAQLLGERTGVGVGIAVVHTVVMTVGMAALAATAFGGLMLFAPGPIF